MKHKFLVAYTKTGVAYILNTDASLTPATAEFVRLDENLFFISSRKMIKLPDPAGISAGSHYCAIECNPTTYIPISNITLMQEIEFVVDLEDLMEFEMTTKELEEYKARKLNHEAHHADDVSYPE